MINKRGWKIAPTFDLPDGFELWEQDDHCVDLYYGDEHVAIFSVGAATDQSILDACREHTGEGGG